MHAKFQAAEGLIKLKSHRFLDFISNDIICMNLNDIMLKHIFEHEVHLRDYASHLVLHRCPMSHI